MPTVMYDRKGISIYYVSNEPKVFSWKVIEKEIGNLITNDDYFTNDQKKEYFERFLREKMLSRQDLEDVLVELSSSLPIAELRSVNRESTINKLVFEQEAFSKKVNGKVLFSKKGLSIITLNNQKEFFFKWEDISNRLEKLPLKKETSSSSESEELSLFDFVEESSIPTIPIETQERENVNARRNYYNSNESHNQYSDKKREKFQDNIQAIRLVNELERDNQQATREQQAILARYSGWGGLQEAFDERNTSWHEAFTTLKELLPENDYLDARKSVLTAFYTPNEVIQEMYTALGMIGDFSTKTVLDAGMGTGNFFMNLPDNLQRMHKIGIEIDPITSKIAKQLFPEAQIHATGYESVELAEKVDLVVGNVPFNDISVRDKKYDSFNFRIHDYFLAKSVDSLKENGVMMVITSSSTLDKKNSKAREYLAKRANLIGAVRLPKTAFKQTAGTEVISDILIFQKKSLKEMTEVTEMPSWVTSSKHSDYDGLFMNNYFIEHPEAILGTISIKNFHGQTLDVLPTEVPLRVQLSRHFKEKFEVKEFKQTKADYTTKMIAARKPEMVLSPEEITLPDNSRSYSFLKVGQSIVYHRRENDFDVIPKGRKKNKISKMIAVKEALNEVIAIQQRKYEESELNVALRNLNTTYDSFVSSFGNFNDKQNMRDLRIDDQFPLLMSVEKEKDNTYVKQDIFFKATIRPTLEITSVDSAAKGLQLSLAKQGKVDFDYIQRIYPNKDKEEILAELGNSVFLNPRKIESLGYFNAWESADDYLTGEVKEKLSVAKIAYERAEDPVQKERYKQNVAALEQAQPEPLQAGDIDFQIGSTWIPTEYYNQFLYELLEVPENIQGTGIKNVYIEKVTFNSSWKIHGYFRSSTEVLLTQTYGTGRKNAYELIENSLNLQKAKVTDQVYDPDLGKYKYILNPEETMLAREKQEEIESLFHEWLFSDTERRTTLVSIYNEKFNTIVPRSYDGRNLIFDDMNLKMELREHQKNVIARILYSGKALMAHEVGAGKTAAMLSAGMYLKQNNLIHKPLYVVPNHLTEQWGKEILTFYPSAKVLVTTKKDFEKTNRNAFVSKIATGDYDAIIIGHSQFERIPLSKERQIANLNAQLSETLKAVMEAKAADDKSFTVKQIEKYRETLKNKLDKLKNQEKKDDLLTFEQLGVDFLFVDEAHAYKNLFVYTKMTNVAGVGKSNSQRATDMLDKVRYIQEKHEGKNVVFATGTPISNSMSEMYVMQHFLQPEELLRRGLTNFDAWASTFGQVVSSLEITPEASGYRIRDRFKKFHNLPELMKTFNLVADIQTADMLNLPVPELKTGNVQTVVAEKSPFQNNMMDDFVIRSEKIRTGSVDPHIDNMLKLTHEAKLMAIDSRLIDDTQPRDPESKISLCCDRVYAIWERTKENRSTQMIFSDAGTPKKDMFNVYDEIKDQLREKGIPENEIAFIHDAKTDAQRDALFEKMKSGEIRVLLGSTQKLGTGTNVQHKLIAAHHIDCPWKPSDLTQREGRILRQGNENKEVEIFRYITKGTFDSYLWQIQEQKLTYISQVMTGKSISRSCEDLDETVLSASEVKAVATENPLLAEKMTIDNEVTRLQLLRSRWDSQRSKLDNDIRITYPNKLAKLNNELSMHTKDLAVLANNPEEPFSITIKGKVFEERKSAFEEINAIVQLAPSGVETDCGEYRGLKVRVQRNDYVEDRLILSGNKDYVTTFTPQTGIGNIARLVHLPTRVEELVDLTTKEITETEKQIQQAKLEVEKPFSKQEELNEKVARQRQVTKQIELDTLRQAPKIIKQAEKSL
ncbi:MULTISPECIES: SNF2-related protein [unclassified Enterococcus]|uniref:SNF2-related protein n=1 Tax=Enterococcus sp. 7E2_DIV0204 TaxID=1834188 RepID=UPI000A33C905